LLAEDIAIRANKSTDNFTADTGNNKSLIAANTVLSTNFEGSTANQDNIYGIEEVDFVVTEDLLNEMLVNITLSAISLGRWKQTVLVSQNLTDTVYSLSHPLNIFVPYTLLLLLALPFLGVGLWSLHSNGVAAQDGGFFQLLVTTTGSRELHRAAARSNGLGGGFDIPQELKDMKVKFGQFVDENKTGIAMPLVGFGGESEIQTLLRRKRFTPKA
jgi:hypothetical protein